MITIYLLQLLSVRPAPPHNQGFLGIYLKRVSVEGRQYARVKPESTCEILTLGKIETIYVHKPVQTLEKQQIFSVYACKIRTVPNRQDGYELIRSRACLGQDIGSINWREFQLITMITFKISITPRHLAGALLFQSVKGKKFVILLGSTTELGVGFDVVPLSNIENVEELRSSFIPRAAGTRMILGNHQGQVNAEPQRITAKRYFMVDIFIQAISVSRIQPMRKLCSRS